MINKKSLLFNSITYGKLTHQEMFKIIEEKIKGKEDQFSLTVGTDSQTFSKESKVVVAIALHHIGYGGIFFYSIEKHNKFKSLREKIYYETMNSIDISKEMTEYLYDKNLDIEILIHVDIGQKGKTSTLINEILGYVKAEGFKGFIKPESNTASRIADKISK